MRLLFWKYKEAPAYVPERLNIYARQGNIGLETYASADLDRLDAEYKRQLIEFFSALIEKLKKPSGVIVDKKAGRV
jgi:hypothetical protein